MNEKEIIKYQNDEDERNKVRVERSNRKRRNQRRNRIRPLFSILLIFSILFIGYKTYPFIESFITQFNSDNSKNPATPLPDRENNEETTDLPTTPPVSDEPEAPSHHFPIIESPSGYLFVNESQYDFIKKDDFSPTKAGEVYEKYGTDAPLVLITHKACTESYSNGKSYYYDDSFYSENENVGDIGLLLCTYLNSLGINAIHLNDIYAFGNIYNSSQEYEKSIEATLKQFPSIAYVLCISRDISINKDMSMIKNTILYNDIDVAQLSFISGSSNVSMTEEQLKNANFAFSLAEFINSKTDCLVKKNTISSFELSQNYAPYFLEIDFGSYANSYDEAASCSLIFAELFNSYLN